jgi:hypothetical protein
MPVAQDSKLHSLWHVAVSAAVLVAIVAGAAHAQPGATACPPRSIGPGALLRGGTAGATCLLDAYRHGCAPAVYELSTFGVDTIGTLRFQLVRRGSACTIDVTRSFRVVPQPAHVTARGRCARLGRTNGDIVATRCAGINAPISLTRNA